ncbi:hypothetical protein [Bdellovibrio sp. HCB209]|uniref:hypothetical protein n=1 Tax=Bdellovibrio sp. HCB209 TaxID=3394354 RepID=UPI0039B629CC
MKTLLFLLATVFSTAHAEIFEMKISAQEACATNQNTVTLNLTTQLPSSLRFLFAEKAAATPQALLMGPAKNPNDSYGAVNDNIQLTTADTKIYSLVKGDDIKILIQASRALVCGNTSQIHMVYSLMGSDKRDLGHAQISIVNENLKKNELVVTNTNTLIKEINKAYAKDLEYYLSEDFLWSKNYADLTLSKFFSSIDEKYIPEAGEIPKILTNPLYRVELIQDYMRFNYGPGTYIEFESYMYQPPPPSKGKSIHGGPILDFELPKPPPPPFPKLRIKAIHLNTDK